MWIANVDRGLCHEDSFAPRVCFAPSDSFAPRDLLAPNLFALPLFRCLDFGLGMALTFVAHCRHLRASRVTSSGFLIARFSCSVRSVFKSNNSQLPLKPCRTSFLFPSRIAALPSCSQNSGRSGNLPLSVSSGTILCPCVGVMVFPPNLEG